MAAPKKYKKDFRLYKDGDIMRSELSFRLDNPRKMSAAGKRKLKEQMKRGLAGGIVVNNRTKKNGFDEEDICQMVVSGHQRILVMDELSGYDKDPIANDYPVPCAIIEVKIKKESELVLALNNDQIGGEWDIELLGEFLANEENEVDAAAAGFGRMDLTAMFGGAIADGMLGIEAQTQSEVESETVEDLKEIFADAKEYNAENPPDTSALEEGEGGDEEEGSPKLQLPPSSAKSLDEKPDEPDPEDINPETGKSYRHDKMNEQRAKHLKNLVQGGEDDAEFMLVVTFDSDEDLHKFTRKYKLPQRQRYIHIEDLASEVGFEVPWET